MPLARSGSQVPPRLASYLALHIVSVLCGTQVPGILAGPPLVALEHVDDVVGLWFGYGWWNVLLSARAESMWCVRSV